ncbi:MULTISPECIES: hypothetical protein [unclassified Chitinophaga]|uniref:hypothetical protein n=1 Tax=unclassified Chitinophaga TaxID=2619133 RepID=UPI00300FCF0E
MRNGKQTFQSEKIAVQQNMLTAIDRYLLTHNLGNRGIEDGNKRNQVVGLLGEILVIEKLTGTPVNLEEHADGFDGGYDQRYKSYHVDVKTMERKSFVRPDFVNNFYAMQENYKADIIVFCSYNGPANVLEICGWIFKKDLPKLGVFYKKGTKRKRSDGTSFEFREDNYEIENKDLQPIQTLLSL